MLTLKSELPASAVTCTQALPAYNGIVNRRVRGRLTAGFAARGSRALVTSSPGWVDLQVANVPSERLFSGRGPMSICNYENVMCKTILLSQGNRLSTTAKFYWDVLTNKTLPEDGNGQRSVSGMNHTAVMIIL